MLKEAIFHRPEGAYAHPAGSRELRVRLRARRGDLIACHLLHGDRYGREEEELRLEKVGSDELFDWFEGVVPSATRRIRYAFYLEGEEGGLWYGERGLSPERGEAGIFQYPYLCEGDRIRVPEWAKDGIVYQIFPDRFCNGDEGNDPVGTEPWDPGARPRSDSFYGGDLQGMIEKLPYLEALGVNVLYLTPIFQSPSNHKYDTTDYYRVDPAFGDAETLKELVRRAHRRGIRVILDAVFNHAGYFFFAFQDVLEKGADSPYADWFFIEGFPVVTEPQPNYETFANGVWNMPKLNTAHPEVRAYLLDVAEYWTREAESDGWRLDVANEVDHRFWRAFRDRVKGVNPEALIVGEIWHDAGPWLQGDQFDSVMNYLFRDAVLDFFASGKMGPDRFDALLTRSRMLYPEQATFAMFNLLGSHDTERFLTACGGRLERMRLAVLFQMTYPGMPMIYYGDEVGMTGGTDPDCRRPMVWEEEKQNRELLSFYRRLISLRKELRPLRRGDFRTWLVDPLRNLYGFLRRDGGECVGVLLNNSPQEQEIELDPQPFGGANRLRDALSGKTADAAGRSRLPWRLAPFQGAILAPVE
jgi:cyclomaltodextrinase / maltogenic alpha-amylase / neopullulanase